VRIIVATDSVAPLSISTVRRVKVALDDGILVQVKNVAYLVCSIGVRVANCIISDLSNCKVH
jgi:hypothetical protein